MTTKTFDEWSKAGYRIKKGSKCFSKTSRGEALFRDDQVYAPRSTVSTYRSNVNSRSYVDKDDYDYDNDLEWTNLHGYGD